MFVIFVSLEEEINDFGLFLFILNFWLGIFLLKAMFCFV